ncbi:DUF485 domain-containing protein [Pelomicrobium sp.]|jgi:uncharacterized membrane protein (DUF485 family)|uniref:DUF485 domain-containing protein n=1 Tax=Pelomicrobium sp. TaxID=2815319 RepID=UPI002FDDC864
MTDELLIKIARDPRYQALVTRRSRFAWALAAIMLAIYFAFILAIAFDPTLLGRPLGSGVTTVGIPIGIGIIVVAFVLTGVYVYRANTEFDALMNEIVKEFKK